MCVILYNESGKKLSKPFLEVAYNNNPHGYGIMWFEQNRVNTIKGICDFEQIWQITNMLQGMRYALHFRWRTAGKISDEQCHPFQVLNHETHGLDLYMMHNGTIFSMPKDPDKSDTQIFAERFTDKILEKDPEYNLNYFNKLEKVIGGHNKMVFMTSDNRTFFVNKDSGKYIDNIWYSNTYSLQSGYRKTIKTPKNENLELKYPKKDYGTRVIKRDKNFTSKVAYLG